MLSSVPSLDGATFPFLSLDVAVFVYSFDLMDLSHLRRLSRELSILFDCDTLGDFTPSLGMMQSLLNWIRS